MINDVHKEPVLGDKINATFIDALFSMQLAH